MRALAIVCTLLSIAGHANAGDFEAETLFREGRRAAEANNFGVACPKFEQSFKLDPAPGTLLNLGDCEENRGQRFRAWQHFRQLYELLPTSDERKSIADARARALEASLSKLRIMLAADIPASVTRDDAAVAHANLGISVPVDSGRHVIVVTAPGRHERRYEVVVAEGDDRDIIVSTGDPIREDAPAVQSEKPVDSAQRTSAFAVGSFGAATLVTAAVFGGLALSNLASSNGGCTGNVCASQEAIDAFHRARSFAVVADVTLGVGIALVGTAVILLLTAHTRSARTAHTFPMWIGGRF